jgi:putative flippase GtrA
MDSRMPLAAAPFPRTLVSFAAVGVLNTAIDLVLFTLLVAPLGILPANVVSTSAGMAFSFVMNGRHTFGAASSRTSALPTPGVATEQQAARHERPAS